MLVLCFLIPIVYSQYVFALGDSMNKLIPLDAAVYKAQQTSSLFTAILAQASTECSKELLDLISIACDLNSEIRQSLHDALVNVPGGECHA